MTGAEEQFGDEAYPRDEWVRAFQQLLNDEFRTVTHYMVTDGGAFVRVQTWIEVEQPYKQQGIATKRNPAAGIAESISFMPGDYTLKLKRGSNIVVLRKRK